MRISLRSYIRDLPHLELIDIKLIQPSTIPVREDFKEVDGLMESIANIGLIEPIIVRPKGNRFEIVAGHRRYEACRRLRWKEIPCIIIDVDDKRALEIALVENLQRGNLDPIDEALAFKKYVEIYGWGGISELARKLGKSVCYISHRIKLLSLPKPVLELLRNSEINPSQAKELIWVKDEKKKIELARLASELSIPSKILRRMSKADNGVNADRCIDGERYKIKLYKKAITTLKVCKMRLGFLYARSEDFKDVKEDIKHQMRLIDTSINCLLKKIREMSG